MSILQAFIVCQHFGMNKIDVENMEIYLTVYNFCFMCCKLALYCETIMCLTYVLEVTMKSLKICVFNFFFGEFV
jgi:hypothetical protein